jgi:hypothetical protein
MKYLALMFLILAMGTVPARAAPDAATQHSLQHAARSFHAWKLEVYRRRSSAAHFNIEQSMFHDSLLGIRSDAVPAGRQVPEVQNWRHCPAGYQSGSFIVSIELPQNAPAGLRIQLLNRNHELICSRSLEALYAGRTDIEITLDDAAQPATDTNPTEILLQYTEQWQQMSITSIEVQGQCAKLGRHEFGSFDLSDVSLASARRLIIY